MTCYQPKLRVIHLGHWETAADGHKYQKAHIETPTSIKHRIEQIKRTGYHDTQIIPCGKCIGCRLEYSQQWANRGFLQAKYSKNNYFITLTYDDENLIIPEEMKTSNGNKYTKDETWKGTLKKEHMEKFLHDLRQEMERKYNHKGIKYMMCGEYGEEEERPHYHAILFNCPLPTESFYAPRFINREIYYQNKIIEKCWKKGISNITEATWNNIAYTARYITKKINGKESEDYYAKKGQVKEIFRVSKGIGKQYFEENQEKIMKEDKIYIKNKKGVNTTTPPKYFDRLAKKSNPEQLEKNKIKRAISAENRIPNKLRKTSKTLLEQLAIEEEAKTDKTKLLNKRNLTPYGH